MNKENSNHIVKILEIDQLTHDVKRFRVEKPTNYRFIPGQATEVAVNQGDFRDRFHPFTFTNLNEDNYLEFMIKGYPVSKYPNHSGVTERIHQLEIGDELLIKGPVGTIKYKGKGVFLAGGAGITPFVAIFRDLEKKNELDSNTLIFSNKNHKDIIIKDELEDLFSKNNLLLTLTREKVKDCEYGRIDSVMMKKHIKDFNQYFYICGPSGFEESLISDLVLLGVNRENIIIEEW